MNKKELINDLAKRTGLKKYEVRMTVEAFIDVLEERIQANEKLNMKRLGVFTPIYQNTRPVRNPRTGDPCMLEPRNSIKFRPGNDLLRRLNDVKESFSD